MSFSLKEISRAKGNPTKLFLFKGTDPTLESLMRSVTIIPGATEFGYGTTMVTRRDYAVLPYISNWNAPILTVGATYRATPGTPNAPPSANALVGRTTAVAPNIYSFSRMVAMDHTALLGWQRTASGGIWGAWSTTAYDPTVQAEIIPTGIPKNFYSNQGRSDFEVAVDDLLATAPHLKHVSLVVAWHGTDLRCGECEARPRVETAEGLTSPYEWAVAGVTRTTAQVVTQVDGRPAYGGAPADRSIYEAIVALKARGLQVTLYPFLMMDIAENNTLPDPYGGPIQGAYPWRGRVTCFPAPGQPGTVDNSTAAADQVNSFFGSVVAANFAWNSVDKRVTYSGAAEWKFQRFILHMATIANAAGADDFLIGSEMVGLTSVRGAGGTYPAVERLKTLAAAARTILGADVKISYAADWSEYHSHQVENDLRFNMDPLWSDANIDYVAIDNYLPAADWRDGYTHLDWVAGYTSIYDPFYLKTQIEGGELYDWYYSSPADRIAQNRTPITDGAYGEPWVYRQKDIRNWWENAHHNRIAGVRQAAATEWVAESKPIVFTELGCPAIDKGPNQPNTFVDRKSSESLVPYFSNGRPDAAVMRALLEATLDYWNPQNGKNDGMIDYDRISLWTWDARPYPVFPVESELFGDAANWVTGHWLTGRVVPGRAFEYSTFGPYAFTNAEEPITRAGITYEPWPIKHSEITTTGNLDKSDITVTLAAGTGLEDQFVGYPPSQVINLTIFQGHMDDVPSLVDYPAQWLGRVTAPEFGDNEVAFNCVPVSTSIQRPGLRRNYQHGCPHVLYGAACQANKETATTRRTVTSINRNRVTFSVPLTNGATYIGGLLEWTTPNGVKETRTIAKVSNSGTEVSLRGSLRGLLVGATVGAVLGCGRNMQSCKTLHDNILNYGGQPFIPLDNPLSQKNQFY